MDAERFAVLLRGPLSSVKMKRKGKIMGLFIIGAFVGTALTVFGLFLASIVGDDYVDGIYEDHELEDME